jgi:hypothetical protein
MSPGTANCVGSTKRGGRHEARRKSTTPTRRTKRSFGANTVTHNNERANMPQIFISKDKVVTVNITGNRQTYVTVDRNNGSVKSEVYIKVGK